MDLYRATFAGSILLNTFALYQSHRWRNTESSETPHSDKIDHRGREESDRDIVRKLKWRFFPIYLLVNAADWLQGPYIYPIYKGRVQLKPITCIWIANNVTDEKGLPEETVAFLFLIGFVSAGISASFAGTFADRHGRRTACLAYCTIYSLSSLTLLSDNIFVLFFGRILGGISGTLLWSVFESWLVAEFNKLMLDDADADLASIFSMMTTSNTCVAIVAGLLAEWLVGKTGTAKAPFLVSTGCLGLAFVAISKYWVRQCMASSSASPTNGDREKTMVPAIAILLRQRRSFSRRRQIR